MSMTTSSVRFDPKSADKIKQKPSAVGITKVGRSHSLRLAREIKELLSRNILAQVMFDSNKAKWITGDHHSWLSKLAGDLPPESKPLVCQCVFVDKTRR